MLPSLYGKTSRSSSLFHRRSLQKPPALPLSQEVYEHGDFVYRRGSKCHAYPKDVAPYPLSYEREVMELNLMDRALIYRVKNDSVTFTDYETELPKRCLDLGCGLGTWTLDAAKQWPECEFIGFDLVDIQVNLDYVEPSIASRIKWMHGNFLGRLPFDDEEFDHVHLFSIAMAVPEDKWFNLFDEINRILKPGGHVEQIEEDARFPTLPRWFTQPLHNAVKRNSHKNNADSGASIKYYEVPPDLPHDHALLEMLFYSVFENRFINPRPCSILPVYFSATFTHVVSPPTLCYPMPPLAPLPPFFGEAHSLPATLHVDTKPPDSKAGTQPSVSASSASVAPNLNNRPNPPSRTNSSSYLAPANVSELPGLERVDLCPHTSTSPPASDESTRSRSTSTSSSSHPSSSESATILPSLALPEETVQIGGADVHELFPTKSTTGLDEHRLYLHLYRAAGLVFGVKEAMWDELRMLVRRRDESLVRYGWASNEYSYEASRERFEAMWERYRADLHVRIALWHPMMHYGWPYPIQDPMTDMEMADQEQLRKSILEARQLAREEEIQPMLRVVRLLVGRKED